MSDPHSYQAQYGLPARLLLQIVGCAAFVVVALTVPTFGTVLKVVTIGFFGAGFIIGLLMFLLMRGKVALRVDQDGITLGGTLFRYASTTLVVPWQDIAAVVLFQQRVSWGTKLPYIGLRRTVAAQESDPPGGRSLRGINAALIPHVPADVVATSRQVNGWKLDRVQLAAAINAYAPHVPLRIVE